MKATLKDVAREAGFSIMTVSNVLNGKKLNHASPESRKLILDTAERLNYRPNLLARQLVTRKNHSIGLLIDSMSPWFYRDVMMRLERMAFEDGYRLQIGLVHNNFDSIRQYVDDFAASNIESVICAAHNYPEFGAKVPELFKVFKHVVFLEEPLALTDFPVVATDHYGNYYRAVRELLRRGRKRIVCFRSKYQDRSYLAAQEAIRAAYREAGIPYKDEFWYTSTNECWKDETQAMADIEAALALKPDTMIAGNEQAMFWALRCLKEKKLKVPDDIALFSAELGSYTQAAQPSFSGFDYDSPKLAESIYSKLKNQFDESERKGPSIELFPAVIVWGESCSRD